MFLSSIAKPYLAHRGTKSYLGDKKSDDDSNCLGTILVISHLYPRSQNGTLGIFVHEQARALQRLGYRVYVLSGEPLWVDDRTLFASVRAFPASWGKGVYFWEEREGVPFLRFPYPVGARYLSFPAHALSYTLAALKCLSVVAPPMRFDLIHAHTSFTDGTAATVCGRIYDRPVVITEHTGPFSFLTDHRLVRFQTQRSVRACDALVAVSSALLTDMRRDIAIPPDLPVATIPNVVDADLFNYKYRERAADDPVIMLWVGHFTSVKRVDRLLKALGRAIRANDRLLLRLVGAGEGEVELRALTSALCLDQHVQFLGLAARNELPQHYQSADFTVVSSDTETFSVVSIESLSCGRPVLATRCGGPEDIIADERFGLLVDRDEADLAQGMLVLAERLPTYDGPGIAAAARRHYTHDTVGRQIKAVYDHVLASGRGKRQRSSGGFRAPNRTA